MRAAHNLSGDTRDGLALFVNQAAEEVERLVAEGIHQRELPADARKRMNQAERLAAFGELAGGVAHELNRPLPAEDDELVRAALAKVLEDIASHLDLTCQESEALELLGEHVYEGVVTDLNMPGQAGIAVASWRVRQQAGLRISSSPSIGRVLPKKRYDPLRELCRPCRALGCRSSPASS